MKEEPTVYATTVAQVLQRARQRVEAGWARGVYRYVDQVTGVPVYCALGSIECDANCMEEPLSEAVVVLAKAIRAPGKAAFGQRTKVVWYNDEPCRTKKQILKAFDRALTEVTK